MLLLLFIHDLLGNINLPDEAVVYFNTLYVMAAGFAGIEIDHVVLNIRSGYYDTELIYGDIMLVDSVLLFSCQTGILDIDK